MNNNDLAARTLTFARDVALFTEGLPRGRMADVFGRQLLRAASSVGANFRSAGRAQSVAHLISKLSIVEEEADECCYWLELMVQVGVVAPHTAAPLRREASELVAIVVASKKRLRARAAATNQRNSKFAIRNSASS